jgi:23S rRNA (cytosine1962-C5)-methyltransferase
MINQINFTPQQHNNVEQARRLLHGRGHAYPGYVHVNVDWLPPVALITLYKESDHDWLMALASQLMEKLPNCKSVQVQYRCRPMAPTEVLLGEEISELIADIYGLKFHLQLGRAQNSGLFLDMSNGWRWVREHAKQKRVLNLFSYTCAFSVAAIAGGAEHVVNVDISKASLTKGRENHRLNQHDTKRVTFQSIDIFKSFSRLKKLGPYDLLICDPPEFQKGSVDIRRDYPKIIRRIPELMNHGGELMLCLNSPDLSEQFLSEMVAQHCPACAFIETVTPPPVFVEAMPGKGLKVMIFRYLSAAIPYTPSETSVPFDG